MRVLFLALVLTGCASGPQSAKVFYPKTMMADTLRVRRPPAPAMDPGVGPGGPDYRANPKPSRTFDCQEVNWLFKDMKLGSLAKCFQNMGTKLTLHYRLERKDHPVLTLQPVEGGVEREPTCVEKQLKSIPVPREIYFYTDEPLWDDDPGGEERCMASRLFLDSDRFLGIKLPGGELQVEVDFPLKVVPREGKRGHRDVVRLLTSWSLTPFFHEVEEGGLKSRRVTTRVCDLCYGRPFKPNPRILPMTEAWPL